MQQTAETGTARMGIVNSDEAAETRLDEAGWICLYKPLTPTLDAEPGRLGVNLTRVPPGQVGCPLHTHLIEDEVFYILSGRGVLRYGDLLREVAPGDCIACPAGTGIGHQFVNPGGEDLVYLSIGMNDPHEVCTYPESGKVFIRGLQQRGTLDPATSYMQGEPWPPRVFAALAAQAWPGRDSTAPAALQGSDSAKAGLE